MLQLTVCATSANVCVGFDVLGIALDLKNYFTFEKKSEFSFKGFDNQFSKCENNLVYYSYKYTFDKANKPLIPVEIGYKGDVPVSRGLGSSSTLIVAGVFAANEMLNNIFTKEELLKICVEIEGHPDNVAPAIYGGLVASFKKKDNTYQSINYEVSNDLKFHVVIPPFELSTHEARGVLPKELNYADIVNNLSRIIHIPLAFKNADVKLLQELFVDKMHEPYRSKLIKGYDELLSICQENDAAFAISGSGSTMLIISKDNSIVDKVSHIGYDIKTLTVGSGVEIKEV